MSLKYKIQPIMVEKSRQQDLDRVGPSAPTIRRQNPLNVFSQLPLPLLSPGFPRPGPVLVVFIFSPQSIQITDVARSFQVILDSTSL